MQTFLNEQQFHAWCFQWFWNTYPHCRGRLFHIQQKAINAIEGSKFKAMGVSAGVSDFIFIGKGFMAFIELKWGAGKQSKEQRAFQDLVEANGHLYFIIKSEIEWKNLIVELLNTGSG